MTRWIQIFLGFAVAAFVAAIIAPVFLRAREYDKHRSACQSNLKQIGLGFLQYTQDYNERFPQTATDGGWAAAIQPYIKSTQIYQCPQEQNGPPGQPDPKLTGYTDYFYNSNLQRRKQQDLVSATNMVMVADGNDGQDITNGTYAKTEIPTAWRNDNSSPAYRHLDTANYLFADGHVKGVKVENILTRGNSNQFYFQFLKP